MPFKLLESIMIDNNGINIIPIGTTISEVTIDLDRPYTDTEQDRTQKLFDIVQQWVNEYRPRFGENWSKIADFLQPAIDAIHNGDINALKSATIKLADRSDQLAKTNPKAKDTIDQIHSLYIKLLGMARGVFGESIDRIINIITERRLK